jgi:predicted glycoside hydrolase/deacetylase ChbG (UPF0249 family)
MAAGRYLIVNADDFGQSPGVNRGVIQGSRRGIVTSASLMVRWPAAGEAADFGRANPQLSLGLHLDLGEWAFRNEEWVPVYEVVSLDSPEEVAAEVSRQLNSFRRLVGREPTHIDSHQHVHRSEPVRSLLLQVAGNLKVPVRHFSPVRYCGDFYGQTGTGLPFPEGITAEWLIRILSALPTGVTELACHPAVEADGDSMYRTERVEELQTLCDPRIRGKLGAERIELCSYHDLDRPLISG